MQGVCRALEYHAEGVESKSVLCRKQLTGHGNMKSTSSFEAEKSHQSCEAFNDLSERQDAQNSARRKKVNAVVNGRQV
jgi:hypothetical protein